MPRIRTTCGAVGFAAELGEHAGLRWRVEAAWEHQDSLRIHATPAWGSYERTIPARALHEERLVLGFSRPAPVMLAGFQTQFAGSFAAERLRRSATEANDHASFARAMLTAHGERQIGDGHLIVEGTVAGFTGRPTLRRRSWCISADRYRDLDTTTISSPAGWVRVPDGMAQQCALLRAFTRAVRQGSGSSDARAVRDGDLLGERSVVRSRSAGWYPAVGVGALLFFDMLRVDVARGLRSRPMDVLARRDARSLADPVSAI